LQSMRGIQSALGDVRGQRQVAEVQLQMRLGGSFDLDTQLGRAAFLAFLDQLREHLAESVRTLQRISSRPGRIGAIEVPDLRLSIPPPQSTFRELAEDTAFRLSVQSAERRLNALLSERDNYIVQVAELQTLLQDAETQAAALTQQLTSERQDSAALRAQLTEAAAVIEGVRQELQVAQAAANAVQAEVATLRNDLAEAVRALNAQTEAEAARARITDSDLQDLREALRQQDILIAELQANVSTLEDTLQHAVTRAETLEAELQSSGTLGTREREIASESMRTLREQLSAAREDSARARDERDTAVDAHLTSAEFANQRSAEAADLQQTVRRNQDRITELEAAVRRLSSSLAETTRRNRTLQSLVQTEHRSHIRNIAARQQAIEDANAVVREQAARLQAASIEEASLQRRLQSAEARLSAAQREVDSITEEMLVTQAQNEQNREAEVEARQESHRTFALVLAALQEAAHVGMQEMSERAATEQATLSAQVAHQQADIASITAETQELRNQLISAVSASETALANQQQASDEEFTAAQAWHRTGVEQLQYDHDLAMEQLTLQRNTAQTAYENSMQSVQELAQRMAGESTFYRTQIQELDQQIATAQQNHALQLAQLQQENSADVARMQGQHQQAMLQLQAERDTIQRNHDMAAEQVAQLQQEAVAATAAHESAMQALQDSMQAAITGLDNQVRTLDDRYQQAQALNESHTAATAAGHRADLAESEERIHELQDRLAEQIAAGVESIALHERRNIQMRQALADAMEADAAAAHQRSAERIAAIRQQAQADVAAAQQETERLRQENVAHLESAAQRRQQERQAAEAAEAAAVQMQTQRTQLQAALVAEQNRASTLNDQLQESRRVQAQQAVYLRAALASTTERTSSAEVSRLTDLVRQRTQQLQACEQQTRFLRERRDDCERRLEELDSAAAQLRRRALQPSSVVTVQIPLTSHRPLPWNTAPFINLKRSRGVKEFR
jgi:hypothetical protein